jgi:hypothetical protein
VPPLPPVAPPDPVVAPPVPVALLAPLPPLPDVVGRGPLPTPSEQLNAELSIKIEPS